MSAFVPRSARTETSFGFCRSGRGAPLRSRGIGGIGYISSIVCANSSARATRSGKIRISRPSASTACVSFSSETTRSISGSISGCADTISVFVAASPVISTGCWARCSAGRDWYDWCSTCAMFSASVVRSRRIRSGGRVPSRLMSIVRTS